MKNTLLNLTLLLLSTGAWSQFQVGHTTITFNDPARTGGFGSGGGPGRQIQSEIYYPATAAGDDTPLASGEFPVITFGHGFVMAWSAYDNIWTRYAAQGYILVFPRTEGGFSPSHAEFAEDLKVVTQQQLALNSASASVFYQKVKQSAVIMGHSMGGGSSILAASGNSTIKGVVGLAPAETNPSAISAATGVTVPALIFSGAQDGVTPPVDHHQPIYDGISSACKSYVSIIGGAHCYFANTNFNCDFGEGSSSTGISISRQDQQDRTYEVLDPWLKYILYDDCQEKSAFFAALAANPTLITTTTTCVQNPVPVVSLAGNGLSINLTGTAYQWLLNGTPISGANSDTYSASATGNYSVEVTFADGCTETSNTVYYEQTTGLDTEKPALLVHLYPNPASDRVYLDNLGENELSFVMFDMHGKVLLNGPCEEFIDIQEIPSGVYSLEIAGRRYRIVKQ